MSETTDSPQIEEEPSDDDDDQPGDHGRLAEGLDMEPGEVGG